MNSESGKLAGWKAISDYLNVTVKTATEWEKKSLPVYHPVDGGTVYAFKDELDSWIRNNRKRASRHRLRPVWVLLGVTGVTAVLLVVVMVQVFLRAVPVIYVDTVTIPANGTHVPDDFENSVDGWGEHPERKVNVVGQGATRECRQTGWAHSGSCALAFRPTDVINQNAYVTIVKKIEEEASIEAWVSVEETLCSSSACSTAKIIAWDSGGDSYEGEYVELRPGWKPLFLDLRGKGSRPPFTEVGIHVYFVEDD